MNKKEKIKRKHAKIAFREINKAISKSKCKKYFTPFTYKMNGINICVNWQRPSKLEVNEYIKDILRNLYFNNVMNRSAYYTLKGMVRRGGDKCLMPVFNFIKKE